MKLGSLRFLLFFLIWKFAHSCMFNCSIAATYSVVSLQKIKQISSIPFPSHFLLQLDIARAFTHTLLLSLLSFN